MKLLRLVLLTAVILMGFSASALSESVLALPAKLTSIESEGFRDDVSIREVVIPDSCTQIGSYAFAGCTGLQKATIPPTVTHIGEHAFMGCDQVVIHCVKGSQAHAYARDNGLSYSLEGCVESGAVGRLSWAYMEDGELIIGGVGAIPGRPAEGEADPRPWQKYASTATKLTVETGVTQIGDYAFSEYKIKEVSFPNTLASIGECAFYRTYLQGSLVLPDSVTELGKEAFYLTFLSSVKLSAGLKTIPEGCFEGNLKLSEYSKLRSVVIPEGIETIGAGAFAWQNLGDVTLPSTIRVIEASAFWRSFVTSVNLPEGVTTIGAGAFYRCRLKELVLPDSLVSLGKCAFGMNSFSYVRIPPNVSGFPYAFALSEYDELYDWYEYSNVMPSPNGLTDADIADGVASISEGAFEGSLYLKRVGIPSSVTVIEAKAFRNCWGLETLVIPNSVTRIGAKAFDNCIGLVNIALPASVTEIDDTAFDNCGHLTITAQEGTYAWQWASQRGLLEPEASPVGDFTYTLSDGGCAITGYTGNDPDIVVPNRIEGVFVTDIAANTFANQTMQSIALPAMLRTIGDAAFSNCDGLTAVDIPVYVTAIGNSAFNGCDSLESVALFDSPDRDGAYGYLETIGNGAFANCASLLRLELPNSVTSLGDDFILGDMALQYLKFGSGVKELTYTKTRLYRGSSRQRADFDALNPALETVIIPKGVESIGEYAFSAKVFYSTGNVYYFDNCAYPNLKSVSLPQSLTRIGDHAFAGARQLSDINLFWISSIGASAFQDCASIEQVNLCLSSSEVLPESAFSGCTSLRQVGLNYGMTAIENNAFYNCDALQSVGIPSSVTSIGENAFYGCDSLESVTLREGLEAIGNSAFANCASLLRLELPDSVTSLGDDFIKGDLALKYIRFGGGVPELTYTKTRLYTGTSYYYSSAYQSVNPALETVVFGEGVTDIGPYVFSTEWYCIPNSNNYVYNNCGFPNLKSVSLPQSLARIGNNAFAYATALDDIVIPPGVSDIGASAFRGCTALKEANIPAGVASVAESTFYGCTALETVTLSTGLKAIGNSAFYGCTALVDAALPQGLETIGNDAFNNCDALPAATIPSSVTDVGSNAYNGCDALESLALNEGLVTIGNGAFANCASLLRLEVPDSVTELGDDFINGDLALKHVRFGGGVPELTFSKTRLYSGSSYYYSSAYASVRPALETVEIGEGVTAVDSSAFSADYFCYANTNNYVYNNCYYPNLKSVSLPQSLTRIGNNAFAEAGQLTDYNIPSKMKTIGTYAFRGCLGPESLTIPETTVSIGANAFEGNTNVKSVAFRGSNVRLYTSTFANCEDLETVVWPSNESVIPDHMFQGCRKLSSVTLPPALERIGAYAFDQCVTLKGIDFSKLTSLWKIGDYAFRGCALLETVDLSPCIQDVGAYAFYGCEGMQSLSLSPTTTSAIGPWAFAQCPNLTVLEIPSTVISVGENVIQGDYGLKTLLIAGGVTATSAQYRIGDMSRSAMKWLIISGNVNTIGENAFANWTGLLSVSLPSVGLKTIGAAAFAGCENVSGTLTLSSGLYTLGSSAFAGCRNWVKGRVVIPYNVRNLYGGVFSGCDQLTSIVMSSQIESIDASAFSGVDNVCLYVPAGSFASRWCNENHREDSGWSYSVYAGDSAYYDPSIRLCTAAVEIQSITSDTYMVNQPYRLTFTAREEIQGVRVFTVRECAPLGTEGIFLRGDAGVTVTQANGVYTWTVDFSPKTAGVIGDGYMVRFRVETIDQAMRKTGVCAQSCTILVKPAEAVYPEVSLVIGKQELIDYKTTKLHLMLSISEPEGIRDSSPVEKKYFTNPYLLLEMPAGIENCAVTVQSGGYQDVWDEDGNRRVVFNALSGTYGSVNVACTLTYDISADEYGGHFTETLRLTPKDESGYAGETAEYDVDFPSVLANLSRNELKKVYYNHLRVLGSIDNPLNDRTLEAIIYYEYVTMPRNDSGIDDITAHNFARTVIKYLNNAPAAYRNLFVWSFMEYNKEFVKDSCRFNSGTNTMLITSTSGYLDGIFDLDDGNSLDVTCNMASLFHESGHAIDYNAASGAQFHSELHGNALYEYLNSEVNAWVRGQMDQFRNLDGFSNMTDAEADAIIEAIFDYRNKGTTCTGNSPSAEIKVKNPVGLNLAYVDHYKRFVEYAIRSLDNHDSVERSSAAFNYQPYKDFSDCYMLGDMIDAVTNSVICPYNSMQRGHASVSNYWYNSDGTATNKQLREAWAEYSASEFMKSSVREMNDVNNQANERTSMYFDEIIAPRMLDCFRGKIINTPSGQIQ